MGQSLAAKLLTGHSAWCTGRQLNKHIVANETRFNFENEYSEIRMNIYLIKAWLLSKKFFAGEEECLCASSTRLSPANCLEVRLLVRSFGWICSDLFNARNVRAFCTLEVIQNLKFRVSDQVGSPNLLGSDWKRSTPGSEGTACVSSHRAGRAHSIG